MAEKKKRKRKSKAASAVLTLAIIACLAVMGYSAYRLISTALEYRRGSEEYAELQQFAVATEEAGTAEATILEVEEDDGLPKCPLKVNWKALKEINEDIIGWIYIGCVDISYPIAQGPTNDTYLRTTVRKQYNIAGSIFLECENTPDFNDPNSIIYGHNMKNDTMFSRLKEISGEEEAYKKDPYFWILTPEQDYVYRMFSARQTPTGGSTYTLFERTDSQFVDWEPFLAWEQEMLEESVVKMDLGGRSFGIGDRIATLSTCTGNGYEKRYVVQGVRLN